MANKIFQTILTEKIERFKFSFQRTATQIFQDSETSRLIHPAEYGAFRENSCREFIRCAIPIKFDIGNGFPINANGVTGTQCDIVIYDRNNSPLIEDDRNQRFYPIESVAAIGEVKSNMSKGELRTALNKLARNKIIKEFIPDFNFEPKKYIGDPLFSFLICNKFNFDVKNLSQELDGLYDLDIKAWQKHNLILSLQDGLFTYQDHLNTWIPFPSNNYHDLKLMSNAWRLPGSTTIDHFFLFASFLFTGVNLASTFVPDMVHYLDFEYQGN